MVDRIRKSFFVVKIKFLCDRNEIKTLKNLIQPEFDYSLSAQKSNKLDRQGVFEQAYRDKPSGDNAA